MNSTLQYPHCNGHAEASKKTPLTTLKKLLNSTKGKWVDKLLGVLWAYRTTNRKPTGISSFALTYGMEAIISIEIRVPTLRIEISEEANTYAITKDLDMKNELREATAIRIASYQQRITKLYNRRVKQLVF